MRGRSFNQEFKRHSCELVENDKLKVPEVCERLDLDRQTLHRWLSEYRELGEHAFTDNAMLTKDAQIKKLEREKKKLEEANEILKKAIAYCKRRKNG
jgi:transposase